MSRSLYARLAQRYGRKIDGATRRDFLRATLVASAGVLLSNRIGWAQPKPGASAKRIVVIGAGFSGLAAAFELMSAGYDVTVIEARNRVGGRVLSFADFVPNKNVEGGGELIGSNHPTWVAYHERFGLEFLDVTEAEDAEFPIILNGKKLDAADSEALWEEMDVAFNQMNQHAAPVNEDQPWLTPDAARLDKQNGKEWIDALDISPLGKAGIYIQLMADNGQDPARQSYLGNLTQVKGGGLEKYWTDSEVYRCKGGNQQLAMKLAEAVGQDRLILGLPVTDVVQKGNNVVVTCKDGRTLECDDVVLSVPPPVWKKINFNPGIPAMLAPQMGSNVKYLAAVKTRFWKDKKLAPDSMTDGDVSMTWEGTDNQEPDDGAALNCFSGGRASEACRAYPDAASRDKAYAEQLEKLYPGFGENFVQSRFMNWPSDPWVMASYSFPAPGEVTKVGPMLHKGLGKLHFAGEHTSYKFIGYMEGGLNSGATVARRLAARDGLLKETPATRPVTPPAPATRRELQPAR